MPKFCCKNKECSETDKVVFIPQVVWVFDKTQNKLVIKNKIFCKKCYSELLFIPNEGDIKCNILKFESMSNEQKKQVMIKRNRKHYEKFEKADVEEKKRRVLEDNRKMFGLK